MYPSSTLGSVSAGLFIPMSTRTMTTRTRNTYQYHLFFHNKEDRPYRTPNPKYDLMFRVGLLIGSMFPLVKHNPIGLCLGLGL